MANELFTSQTGKNMTNNIDQKDGLCSSFDQAAETTRYALAKQVPDMGRGFTISTNYGEISFASGPHADRIRAAVESCLLADLSAAKGTAS